jgi:BlaI family transcriptional regulator, penicillinase repressor
MSILPAPPTEAELAILHILWERGASTVREVHESLYKGTEVGYTTTLKLLQNMLAKRLVTRDERTRQHVYKAAAPKQRTLNSLVRIWIDKTFAGSSAALAMQALDARHASREELGRLKDLIHKIERREGRR